MNYSLLKESGFTLLELAMVLFIITLILGAVLTPLSTRMEAEERKKTTEQLKEIRDSLTGYALVNGHLPCPDCPSAGASAGCGVINAADSSYINDGREDGLYNSANNATVDRSVNEFENCAILEGNLPWATLGVDQFDAWGNRFIYRVTETFADDQDGTGCGTASTNVSFEMCSTGNININDDTGGSVASNVPVAVISYGKNEAQRGNSETENQNNDMTFIQKDYTTGGGADDYDDLLMWIPSSTLIYRMVQAERLP